MKGLRLGILENKRIGNCSNNGISSRCNEVTLVGEGIPEIFEANDEAPAVKVVFRKSLNYYHVQPIDGDGYMAGGTFVYTSDSRFKFDYPLPLHDRQEVA